MDVFEMYISQDKFYIPGNYDCHAHHHDIALVNRSVCVHWLTHWGRETHICVAKLTIIGSENGLSPGRRQSIVWTNAGILLIRTLGTNLSEILENAFENVTCEMVSIWFRPQWVDFVLHVIDARIYSDMYHC